MIRDFLKNEVEIAGRSVSVLLLLGVFLAGSGGAALLTSFGTVSGSANIDQAFTVDGNTGQNAQVQENVALTGGESVVTNHRFNNTLNRSMEINVTSDAPKELSLKYRFVDDLVATTEYRNFEDDQANITGDMKSEFAYNPVDDRVGVHAYGQTVYKARSSSDDAESYAGLSTDIEDVTYTNSTSISINFSEGYDERENMTQAFPYWVRLKVDVGLDDVDSNGEPGEKWIVLEKTVDSGSGVKISGDDTSFGDDAIVYKEGDRSVTAQFTDVVGTSREGHMLERVDILAGSGSDDTTYMDMWFYNLQVNGNRGQKFLAGESGNFTRSFDPGVTEGAVIADARINAYGTGISYGAEFDPITQ